MTKEELIKILRNESNILKDLNNNKKKNDKEITENNRQRVLKYILVQCLFEMYFIERTIAYIFKKEYGAAFLDFYFALYIYVFIILLKMKEYNIKSLKEILDIDFIQKNLAKYKKSEIEEDNNKKGYSTDIQIMNMERAVEFMQSLTKEEQEKYLKLKM